MLRIHLAATHTAAKQGGADQSSSHLSSFLPAAVLERATAYRHQQHRQWFLIISSSATIADRSGVVTSILKGAQLAFSDAAGPDGTSGWRFTVVAPALCTQAMNSWRFASLHVLLCFSPPIARAPWTILAPPTESATARSHAI